MRHRLAILAILAVLAIPCAGANEEGEEAKTFIVEMIRSTGSEPVVCPMDVLVGSREYEMRVICAKYDGDFRSFESLWKQHLLRDAALDQIDGSGTVPRTYPQTAWESRSGFHERIYVVGNTAVGVRFAAGDLVMVYK
jgi:hypothetical protein